MQHLAGIDEDTARSIEVGRRKVAEFREAHRARIEENRRRLRERVDEHLAGLLAQGAPRNQRKTFERKAVWQIEKVLRREDRRVTRRLDELARDLDAGRLPRLDSDDIETDLEGLTT